MKRIRLGRTSIEVTPVGLGCWQFSSGLGGRRGYWSAVAQETVNEIVAQALVGGINWFDTAELYGFGRSEEALAQALLTAGIKPGDVRVATKWNPFFRTAGSIGTSIGERLRRLSPFAIDLHQVHQPMGFSSVESEMKAMAALVEQQKIGSVGVSNFNESRMRRAHAELALHGLPLASNQVHYNLLHRKIERSGVLSAARELGITIIAYSPLAQGLLTGRFHDDPGSVKQIEGPRKYRGPFRDLEQSRPLVNELRAIAAAHGATPAQVTLAWMTQFHGDAVVVIPGATRASQIADSVGSQELTLSRAELDAIDALSRKF
jgi:aryl-alcohol dehydrogenase-like predicted oxidoreductase